MSKQIDPIDIVFSFDMTGSMAPCFFRLKAAIKDTVKQLFSELPMLRIGFIAHGDYCDARFGSDFYKTLALTSDKDQIIRFMDTVHAQGGGDAPECYEYALYLANGFNWSATAKAVVVIGDEIPHPPSYPGNTLRLDWREELRKLQSKNINAYGVQALNNRHADMFYDEIAQKSGGFKLRLEQFAIVPETLMAICFRQAGPEKLQQMREEVAKAGKMTPALERTYDALAGKKIKVGDTTVYFGKTDKAKLRPVEGGRFQSFDVETRIPIAEFVSSMGITFKPGRGFYELAKKVLVQDHKEVVVEHKPSGAMYTGPAARGILGLPETGDVKIEPKSFGDFRIFIQSTSNNRVLLPGTKFLYEVSELAMV